MHNNENIYGLSVRPVSSIIVLKKYILLSLMGSWSGQWNPLLFYLRSRDIQVVLHTTLVEKVPKGSGFSG